MVRHELTVLAGILAVVLVIGGCATPFLPSFAASVVPGAERHSIEQTGLPAWSDWSPNDGTVRPSDLVVPAAKLQDTELTNYRIAHVRGWVSQFTFYLGRYRNPDGSEVIAPTAGPVPMVCAWVPGGVGLIVLQIALAGMLLVAADSRYRREIGMIVCGVWRIRSTTNPGMRG